MPANQTANRFRFRFWNKIAKRYESKMGLYADGKVADLSECFHNEDSHENYVVEQSTGLLDKNGREVFEGDIVRWGHGANDIGVVEYGIDDPFGSYPNACFFGLCVARFKGLCQFQSDDEYEVIGNIHEHSHLLAK